MRKKAQAALEFLMTYGWAILLVIVVVGALYATGMLKPCRWTRPQALEFQSDIRVNPVRLTTNEIVFEVYYQPGKADFNGVELIRISVDGKEMSTNLPLTYSNSTHSNIQLPVKFSSSSPITVRLDTSSLNLDNKACINLEIAINYTAEGTTQWSRASGRITGPVS